MALVSINARVVRRYDSLRGVTTDLSRLISVGSRLLLGRPGRVMVSVSRPRDSSRSRAEILLSVNIIGVTLVSCLILVPRRQYGLIRPCYALGAIVGVMLVRASDILVDVGALYMLDAADVPLIVYIR